MVIGALGLWFLYIKNNTKESAANKCPDPIYATDPNAYVVEAPIINSFMEYMNLQINQCNIDLDVCDSLVQNTSFNVIVDPSPIIGDGLKIPNPIAQMDSSNPPNYGIVFKLPKGFVGPVGMKGSDGQPGPTGPTGPTGQVGSKGNWIRQ